MSAARKPRQGLLRRALRWAWRVLWQEGLWDLLTS